MTDLFTPVGLAHHFDEALTLRSRAYEAAVALADAAPDQDFDTRILREGSVDDLGLTENRTNMAFTVGLWACGDRNTISIELPTETFCKGGEALAEWAREHWARKDAAKRERREREAAALRACEIARLNELRAKYPDAAA